MRRRISIRGRVRPSVGPSVRRSVCPVLFRRWKVRILGASCAVYPALFFRPSISIPQIEFQEKGRQRERLFSRKEKEKKEAGKKTYLKKENPVSNILATWIMQTISSVIWEKGLFLETADDNDDDDDDEDDNDVNDKVNLGN